MLMRKESAWPYLISDRSGRAVRTHGQATGARRSCGRSATASIAPGAGSGWRTRHGSWRALRARGVGAGDRVLLVAENRPEWAIAELAIMAVGAITVPAYTTNTTETHAYLLNHSEAIAAVVSTDRLGSTAAARAGSCAGSQAGDRHGAAARCRPLPVPVLSWAEALALGEQTAPRRPIQWRRSRDDLACFIYTSGTGGNPKGVMLTHGNILTNVAGALAVLETLDLSAEEVFLSFLPLSHAYEHTAGQFLPMAVGAQIYYADGLEALASNFVEVRPTVVACVPRLYEVMRQRILRMTARQSGLKAKLFAKTIELGSKAYERPEAMSLAERALNRLLDKLVRDAVRARWWPDQGAGVRRGGPALRRRSVLRRAGRAAVSGLRADRVRSGDQCERPGSDQAAYRRAPDPGNGGQDRRGWRDPGARAVGDARLLAGRRRHQPGIARRLAAHRRHWRDRPGWVPPDHRPQEGHHRRLRRRQRGAATGRRSSRCSRKSTRRSCTAMASRIWWR